MGVQIEAAIALTSQGPRRPAARRLADTAARRCLELAGRQAGDVDLLINAGMYREDSLAEPALAALIQEDIGANRGQPPIGGHGTFSFDLLDGACGVINAIQLESGLLRSGVIRLGAIVTSDVCPELGDGSTAPFAPAGGAMLLRQQPDDTGFAAFHTQTFPEYEDLFTSGLVWHARRGPRVLSRAAGRNQMIIDEKPGYQARLADCAEEAARGFLARLGLSVSDIGLLVPAPASGEFLDSLRVRLGIPGDHVAYPGEDFTAAGTTGPIAALQAGVTSGRLADARDTLLLAAGAGITVAMALYHQAG